MGRDVITLIIAITLSIALLFSSCTHFSRTPPSLEDAQAHFDKYYDDIIAVGNYFAKSEYESLFIDRYDKKFIATVYRNDDSVGEVIRVELEDAEISKMATDLIKSGAFKSISKNGNAVYFLMWTSTFEIDSGIACPIDDDDIPEVQYMTEIYQLSHKGWYYCVADYNKAR